MNSLESTRIFALILAGGSGTRFWPLSRKARPKQLIALGGERSLVERTIDRLEGLVPRQNVHVVCGSHHVEPTRELVGDEISFVVEPCARNTAPAIALGAAIVANDHDDPTIAVFPSDHFVRDDSAFRARLREAATIAEDGYIVTLGIEPTRPETGFGYIKYDSNQPLGKGFGVERFVEKPSIERAVEYLDDGRYLWNAGIFVFKYKTLRHEIERQRPALARSLDAMEARDFSPSAIEDEFPNCESVSIDYGIMEGAERVAVVPSACGWSDVGHWAALNEVFDVDQNQNVVEGRALVIDTRDSVIFNNTERLVATAGLDDMVVVATEDVVMVVPRSKAQDVRRIVAKLQETDSPLL